MILAAQSRASGRRARRALLTLVALSSASGACLFDSSVDETAEPLPQISCTDDADCPDDWLCQPTLLQCVPVNRLDRDGPALDGAPTLTPRVGGLNQTFTLAFRVSEPLAMSPAVRLQVADGEVDLAWDPAASAPAERAYVYTYRATGSEGEGNHLITIDLVDRTGNAVEDLSGGDLLLDFTPPRVIGHTLSRSHASRTTVHLQLELNEPVPAPPQVDLHAPGARPVFLAWSAAAASNSALHSYSYTADGNEPEGTYAVLVSAIDAAGNRSLNEEVDQLTLDFTLPSASDVQIVPAAAPSGQRVLVEVTMDEPLLERGGLRAVPASGGSAHLYADAGGTGTRLRFEHTVRPGEDGRYALQVEGLRDLAGNPLTSLPLGEVVYDTTAPALRDYQQSHQSLLASDSLQVSFSVTEPLGAEPVVSIGGVAMARVGNSLDPYVFELAMDTAALVGAQVVQLRLRDLVGNEAVLQPGVAEVDSVPPLLVDLVFTPPAAQLGITAILSVAASEPLAASPTLRWAAPRADPGFTYRGVSGLGHQYALEVTAAIAQGRYQVLEVDLEDVAGNRVTVDVSADGAVFDVDNQPPALGAITTDADVYSAMPGHEVLSVRFDTDASLDQGDARLEVTLAGRPFVCGDFQQSAPSYTCTYLVDGTEAEGLAIVAVRAVDAAGNERAASAPVQLDFTPPALAPGTTQLFLTPPPGCPLAGVDAWTDGAVAQVIFALSEQAGSPPTLHTAAPEQIDFEFASGSGNLFAFTKTLDGEATQQGAYTLEVDVVDAVGNAATLPLRAALPLQVDTAAPQPPAVDTAAALVYRRVPWGNDPLRDGTAAPKTFQLRVAAGAVDADSAWLLVFDGDDPALDAEIGRVATSASANVELQLNRADRTEIYVAAYDAACNRSQALRVRDVEWVATMGFKVPGSSIENPHLYTTTPVFAATLVQDAASRLEPDASQLAALRAVDDEPATRTPEARWQERAGSGLSPGDRSGHGMAFDSARGKLVVFGGAMDMATLQDTWEWDAPSSTWTEVTPDAGGPARRHLLAMVYDSGRDRMIVFGGIGAGGMWPGTWEWNGASSTWSEIATGGAAPSARTGHAMAYDSRRGRVVLFGGASDSGSEQDTWELDDATGEWREVTPAGARPSKRHQHAMVYDSVRGRLVLFGGRDASGQRQDTWEWDGATRTWTDVTPVGTSPEARSNHVMTYDRQRDRVVLLGGFCASCDQRAIWEWNGATRSWAEVTSSTTRPPALESPAMAYDSARGKVMLFAGIDDAVGWQHRLWEWDGARSAWTELTPSETRPAARLNHAMAYDAARAEVVLFGGANQLTQSRQDTWVWDWRSARWREITPVAGSPTARLGHVMFYDSARGKVILFGGFASGPLADTWEWDGASGTWTNRSPAGASPTGGRGDAVAYDPARGKGLLFGGAETWEWSGASGSWTRLDPPGDTPPPRRMHAMAFDSLHNEVLLFAGDYFGALHDTWLWSWPDGSWDEVLTGGDDPGYRYTHTMAYDTARGRALLFSGFTGSWMNDLWEWDGQARRWYGATPSGVLPGERSSQAMAFDSDRGRAIVFGGESGGGGLLQDTWELTSAASARAAHRVQIQLSAAGVEPGSALRSLTATFYAGGTGAPSGIESHGAELLLWDEGRWQVVASNGDAASDPDLLEWTGADTDWLSRLKTQRVLSFAVRSAAPAGTATGMTAVDYAEVTVRYRLP